MPTLGNLGHRDQGGDETGRGVRDEGMQAPISHAALAAEAAETHCCLSFPICKTGMLLLTRSQKAF